MDVRLAGHPTSGWKVSVLLTKHCRLSVLNGEQCTSASLQLGTSFDVVGLPNKSRVICEVAPLNSSAHTWVRVNCFVTTSPNKRWNSGNTGLR